MKGDRDTRDYINDILAEIARIAEFTKEMTFDAFSMDTKSVYAVIRSFEVIGEAVKNITDDVREKHPEIPWKRMAGMRDKLIHEYFGVSTKILWETIKNRIPELKEKLESLREE